MVGPLDRPIAVVLGTRPEAIKLFVLVEELAGRAWLAHTGQHFDEGLAAGVASGLGLRPPDVQLHIGGLPRAAQIGQATELLASHFRRSAPAVVVVQGDTNTALAGALAANAEGIPLVHVEAGLRSFDRAMPEEHNRVLIDHLADLCAAPTPAAGDHLLVEGIDPSRVVVTGNTIVEAVRRMAPSAAERAELLAGLGLEAGRYAVATLHRPENVDDPEALRSALEALGGLDLPVVLPIHPRTADRVEEFGLGSLLDRLCVIGPVPHRDLLGLLHGAALAVSDSGGIQEEVTVLGRFALVLRRSTERPEALGSFAELVGPSTLAQRAAHHLEQRTSDRLSGLPCPFGDGTASQRIAGLVGDLAGAAARPEVVAT